jgi:hypothetical protein
MRIRSSILVGACAIALLTDCTRAPTTPVPTSAPSEEPSGCPLGVEDAQIKVLDTPSGVDLTLTAPADRVDELRRRARDAAALHGPGAHEGLGHEGVHMGAQRHGLRLTEMPPMDASVEDVQGGAILHLYAKVAAQRDELREKVHGRVDEIMAGPCGWPEESPPESARVRIEAVNASGISPARVAEAIRPVRDRLTRCLPGSGGKIEIRIVRAPDGTLKLSVEPGLSIDPTAKDCVLETLSTVELEEAGSNVGGTSLPPTGYTTLIQISW